MSTLPLQLRVNGSTAGYAQQAEVGVATGMWSTSVQQQQPPMSYSPFPNVEPQQHMQHSYSAPAASSMNAFRTAHPFQQQPQQYQNGFLQPQQPFAQQPQFASSPSPFPNQTHFLQPQSVLSTGPYPSNGTSFVSPQYAQQQHNPYGHQMSGGYVPQPPAHWGTQMGTGMR